MSKPRILVFDSGVGGLSVLQEIQCKVPQAEYIYVSDNAAFPYGTKTESVLISRVEQVLTRVIDAFGADMIVIACNTASTLTLPHVRRIFNQPVVGVVPAIKPAAKLSRSKVIGLLATPATVSRPYTHELIKEFAYDCQVILVGSSELVQMAERKLRGEAISEAELDHVLRLFSHHENFQMMDVLVLACTHFPLMRGEIKSQLTKWVPNDVQLIDSGEAIARRVASLLNTPLAETNEPLVEMAHQNRAVFTADTPEVRALQSSLHYYQLENLVILPV